MRIFTEGDDIDTSETLAGRRDRALIDAVEDSEDVPGNRERRWRVGDLHMAFVAEKEVAKVRPQWRNPDLKAR